MLRDGDGGPVEGKLRQKPMRGGRDALGQNVPKSRRPQYAIQRKKDAEEAARSARSEHAQVLPETDMPHYDTAAATPSQEPVRTDEAAPAQITTEPLRPQYKVRQDTEKTALRQEPMRDSEAAPVSDSHKPRRPQYAVQRKKVTEAATRNVATEDTPVFHEANIRFDDTGATALRQEPLRSEHESLGQNVPKTQRPQYKAERQRRDAEEASRRADPGETSAYHTEDSVPEEPETTTEDTAKQADPASKLRQNPRQEQGEAGTTRSKFHHKSQQERVNSSKLRMEKQSEKLDRATKKLARQKPARRPGPVKRVRRTVTGSVHGYVHGKIYENEHENVGIEAAHRSELLGETVYRQGSNFVRRELRQHPARVVKRAENRYGKAAANHRFQQTKLEHPELKKNTVSRLWQRHQLKKRYAKQAREAAQKSAKAAEKTAVTTEKLAKEAASFVKRHPAGTALFLAVFLIIVLLQSCTGAVMLFGDSSVEAIAVSSYESEDADLLGAEAAYCALETELQDYLDNYESTHSYDEYHYDLDDIEHDPYVLLSILSSFHEGAWTLNEVQGTLQMLFDRQYILTETVTSETRQRTETRTDDEGNDYEVEVSYTYTVCTVTLENFNLSHLPIYIMGEEQLSKYALYMATLGNRPELFPNSSYVDKYINSTPTIYDIPPEALEDETFAAMIAEAEKYLGYPYVWGGYSPDTSFDCSGFVSWVINHSGWDVGRLGTDGLYAICTPVSAANARPGDLVFFAGTYDTPGTSHVGIYVGNGWMIHCGDPIQYADLNNSYWQAHFYAYGRLPR